MSSKQRALSPVVASIILIAVTVAVSIAVAAWMGALIFTSTEGTRAPIDKIHFNNDLGSSEIEGTLHSNNISVVLASQINADATYPMQRFDDFLDACRLNNVSCVLTDYKLAEIPPIYNANTSYVVEQYSIWFYQDVPHVGKVAVVCNLDFTAWWLGD